MHVVGTSQAHDERPEITPLGEDATGLAVDGLQHLAMPFGDERPPATQGTQPSSGHEEALVELDGLPGVPTLLDGLQLEEVLQVALSALQPEVALVVALQEPTKVRGVPRWESESGEWRRASRNDRGILTHAEFTSYLLEEESAELVPPFPRG